MQNPVQAVTSSQCQACAQGKQTWWPCNLDGLCACEGFESPVATTVAPPPLTSDDSVCGKTGPECSFTPGEGISSWFSKSMFTTMFPMITDSRCPGANILTYECLVKATLLYPDFANSNDVEMNKRELAAWLGQMSQETTGGGCGTPVDNGNGTCSCGPAWCDSHEGGCASWGLCKVEESAGVYCEPNANYPCVSGQTYNGRGPKQLSYNYNYGQFSEEFCSDKNVLLQYPQHVASNPTLAWASSMWFWFTGGACGLGETCKPGCHEVFLGSKTLCPADMEAGRLPGFGWVTNVINGGLECGGAGGGVCDYRVVSRIRFYKHFCSILGVSPLATGWSEENLQCASQKNYATSPPTMC